MAMATAARMGHKTLLWLDAAMMTLQPVRTVLKKIEKDGYLLWHHQYGQWTVGAWTSDECLNHYEISRGMALSIPMLCSGVFGYSLDHPLGYKLHEAFIDTPAVALRGAWHNRNHVVAKDARVQGHRHDQSVLSILCHKLGLTPSQTPYPVSFYGHQTPETVFIHDPQIKPPSKPRIG
jgi:hypothetical protein